MIRLRRWSGMLMDLAGRIMALGARRR